MATSYLVLPLLIIIIPFSRTAFSQPDPFPPPLPTISGCTSRLLPLTSCAPFVQGMAQFPVQSCCDNLKQLSANQPGCLCLLLTNSTLSSLFPINTTLALQLPSLCGVQVDASVCSSEGVPEVHPPQVSLGANSSAGRNSNSSIAAASPMAHVGPRPVIMGLGQSRGSTVGMKAESSLALLMLSLMFY